ncbi:uncharacterized protein [Henckelia pumila]|uniref:uncharacterized protein n=1 Tax=Henckelia pumila TaxID=405737 RepID=UPI003C6E9547
MPCVIGNLKIERAMLDLGVSINVMPYSIYCDLNLGPLKETRVMIQLADRYNAYPEGVVEDILVQVKELIFPADFYILRMEEDSMSNSPPILLGRPFMKTSRTKIDVDDGTLCNGPGASLHSSGARNHCAMKGRTRTINLVFVGSKTSNRFFELWGAFP